MGAFLSQIVGKLLSGVGEGKPTESEIDGNICVCCGTLNVAEYGEHEKYSDQEKTTCDTSDDDD